MGLNLKAYGVKLCKLRGLWKAPTDNGVPWLFRGVQLRICGADSMARVLGVESIALPLHPA